MSPDNNLPLPNSRPRIGFARFRLFRALDSLPAPVPGGDR